MKEYFSHDYNARNDSKLVKLFMKHGLTGIGAYWCIVEMLYEVGGYLDKSEYERITFELRTNNDTITSVIQDFELFEFDNETFYSQAVLDRLQERVNKSKNARKSVQKRWDKYKKNKGVNTNVKRTYNERNTIKVKDKVKDKDKEKEKTSKKKKPEMEILINSKPQLKENLLGFIEMRKSIKKPMTLQALKILITKLEAITSTAAEQNQILEQSILNNWQSVYELKHEPKRLPTPAELDAEDEAHRKKMEKIWAEEEAKMTPEEKAQQEKDRQAFLQMVEKGRKNENNERKAQ